ncbi:hypothetical protein NDU88_006261 [Pleurodeles waltl]|uniref:Uncharacterized protein n=1 Tax=Pleurodeles waltl TaxID=8319 RepID=A0AAV7MDK7_PLEWA|nr:hypothetical protein NDU88_006261 [Pleurodeles waltl]
MCASFIVGELKDTCFFCDEESVAELINVRTLELSNQVRDAAVALSDSKVLAKLSGGDMVATRSEAPQKVSS